jgi:hypothetical protein
MSTRIPLAANIVLPRPCHSAMWGWLQDVDNPWGIAALDS